MRFELFTERCYYTSNSYFGILINKRSNFEFAPIRDLRALIQWSCHQVYYISSKKSSTLPSLPATSFNNGLDYLENHDVILPISFDGSRNTPKGIGKFYQATEIFKKNEGAAAFAAPSLFEC